MNSITADLATHMRDHALAAFAQRVGTTMSKNDIFLPISHISSVNCSHCHYCYKDDTFQHFLPLHVLIGQREFPSIPQSDESLKIY